MKYNSYLLSFYNISVPLKKIIIIQFKTRFTKRLFVNIVFFVTEKYSKDPKSFTYVRLGCYKIIYSLFQKVLAKHNTHCKSYKKRI